MIEINLKPSDRPNLRQFIDALAQRIADDLDVKRRAFDEELARFIERGAEHVATCPWCSELQRAYELRRKRRRSHDWIDPKKEDP